MRRFLAALQFLTILPVRAEATSDLLGSSLGWFPLVGLLIGGLVAGLDFLAAHLGVSYPLRAVFALGVFIVLSGGLHLDGLADTADGFFSSRSPEAILAIMKDSRIGTMGVLALILILGAKYAALVDPALAPVRTSALVLAPVVGRSLQVIGLTWMPYARLEGGMASVFLPFRSRVVGVWACVFPCAFAIGTLGARTAALLLAAVALLLAVWARSCRATIGGMTGDTLGALSELGEALVLVCASAAAPLGGR